MKESRLPEAEFAIMKYIWGVTPPVTSAMVMANVGLARGWKPQTGLTLLARLCERGFLSTQKGPGREKTFTPLISREQYLEMETSAFVSDVHGRSVSSLLASLSREKLTDRDVDELKSWFDRLTQERK